MWAGFEAISTSIGVTPSTANTERYLLHRHLETWKDAEQYQEH